MDRFIDDEYPNIISDLKRLVLVAAPPFKENDRISWLNDYVSKLGFQPKTDDIGNLVVELDGKEKQIIYSAHVDTVFPEGTILKIKENEKEICCPGICDNTMGIISLLYLMKYIKKNKIMPKHKTTFLFNVGEEELGDLRGIRYYIDNMDQKKFMAHFAIEGFTIGRLTTIGVGSLRWKIKIKTKGGHSWRDFGNPNAIATAAKLIMEFTSLKYPSDPKTTYNIGTIKGGNSVNSIAENCEFTFEIRYTDKSVINSLQDKINTIMKTYDNIEIELLGERPCGKLNETKITGIIKQIHKDLGIKTIEEAGSTDSNYPLSLGLTSMTIAITDARNTHSINEILYKEQIRLGMKQLFRIFKEVDKI